MLLIALLLHQVVAPTQNNRYVKITAMDGQLRLAYTILYGDLPAEEARRKMDANRDGTLSPDEAHAFGEALGRAVGARLTLELDGQRVPVGFAQAEVGLGSERGVHPVPFSIDLIMLVPAGASREHTVYFDDRFALPHEGETEVTLEEAPGVRVTASFAGRSGDGMHGLKWSWLGPRGSDMEDRSLTFRYTTPHGAAAARPHGASRRTLALLAIGALAALGGLAWGWLRRRRITSTAGTGSRSSSGQKPA